MSFDPEAGLNRLKSERENILGQTFYEYGPLPKVGQSVKVIRLEPLPASEMHESLFSDRREGAEGTLSYSPGAYADWYWYVEHFDYGGAVYSLNEIGPADRPEPLDNWLFEQRKWLPRRLLPEEAVLEIADGATLVDTRTLEQKLEDGFIPGAVEIGLNVLEWRLHPTSKHRHPQIPKDGYDLRALIMCNQGYSSTAAAYRLKQELGMKNVTDVVGGFQAWKEAGLPVIAPNILHKLGAKMIDLANQRIDFE